MVESLSRLDKNWPERMAVLDSVGVPGRRLRSLCVKAMHRKHAALIEGLPAVLSSAPRNRRRRATTRSTRGWLCLAKLGSVGIQDSHPGLVVVQAVDRPIRFD